MNAARAMALIGTIAGLAALAPLPSEAHRPRLHAVARIFVEGRPVSSVIGVTVTRGTAVAHSLRLGETIADGTRISVPARVLVIVTSTGVKSTVTLELGSSVTFVSTGGGELVTSDAGASIFTVLPRSLDFFRVQSGESLTASVHGTIFSVDTAGGSVTFTCKRGALNITKSGYLAIGDRRLKTSLIDVISAASESRVTYHPGANWTLAQFSTLRRLRHFRAALAAVARTGDGNAVSAARTNLANVLRLEGRYAEALDEDRAALEFYRGEADPTVRREPYAGSGRRTCCKHE